MTIQSKILKLQPATLVLTSFLLAITIGTVLLKLPVSTEAGYISWVDAIFTATSAVCVTGLIVVDTGSYFTFFGQCVILILFQIGGLGVMTISVALFRWFGRMISLKQRLAMQDLFSHTPREDIFKLVKSIVLLTLSVEAIGVVFLTIHWSNEFPFFQALYTAVFHSVSAFCNAGFSLFSDSMMNYSDNLFLNVIMCTLIVTGGIGFPVLYELQNFIKKRQKERVRLSVQTKTVLVTTLFLIVIGAAMFAFLERETMSENSSVSHRVLVSVFQSITSRTAGFNTVDIGSLNDATIFMIMFLMFFGASPGSCGGGVKTTTLALLAAFTVSRLKHRQSVSLFRRTVPNDTVTRSVALVLVSLVFICIVLFMVLAGDSGGSHEVVSPRGPFLLYLFETVSAFGTVGLSMGVTSELTTWGKYWIIVMMIIGRVGVLTFSYIIVGHATRKGIEYSEENIMIG